MTKTLSKKMLYILERFALEQRGVIMTAWLEYQAYGLVPAFDDLALDAAFRGILSVADCLDDSEVTETLRFQQSTLEICPQSEEQPKQQNESDDANAQLDKLTAQKRRCLEIAAVMQDKDKSLRLRKCSNKLIETAGGYLSSLERCNGRICPICRDIKINRYSSRLQQVFNVMGEKTPNAKYLFATFTVKNMPLKQLDRAIDEMGAAWGKLSKRSALTREMYGFAKVYHIKQGEKGFAHPHIHVIFAMRPDYRKRMNKKDCTDFKSMWAQALGKRYTPQVELRHIMDAASLENRIKYMSNHGITEKIDIAWAAACDDVLHVNKRFVSYGGYIKDILQDIKENRDSDWLDTYNPKGLLVWDGEKYIQDDLQ